MKVKGRICIRTIIFSQVEKNIPAKMSISRVTDEIIILRLWKLERVYSPFPGVVWT